KNRMGAPRNYATACMLRPKVFSMRKKSGRYTMKIKDFGWAVLAVLGAIACGGGGSDTAEGADYAGGVGPGGAGSTDTPEFEGGDEGVLQISCGVRSLRFA